jgi:hypothetical protein
MATRSLPADIVERIARDFTEPERGEVLETLSNLEMPLSSPANDQRVIRCLIVAATGKRENFDQLVLMAKRDWRDVIVAGEYGVVEKKLRRMRNLTHSFPEENA